MKTRIIVLFAKQGKGHVFQLSCGHGKYIKDTRSMGKPKIGLLVDCKKCNSKNKDISPPDFAVWPGPKL